MPSKAAIESKDLSHYVDFSAAFVLFVSSDCRSPRQGGGEGMGVGVVVWGRGGGGGWNQSRLA